MDHRKAGVRKETGSSHAGCVASQRRLREAGRRCLPASISLTTRSTDKSSRTLIPAGYSILSIAFSLDCPIWWLASG